VLASFGLNINSSLELSVLTVFLSNIVSNVPAVMLLLNHMDLHATHNLYMLGLTTNMSKSEKIW
jgi:Na+/H+ antiporter NhaD/arsenite permease-like protein